MKKILCPTDFSETARNAIAYAAKFAKTTGASLSILHIQSSPFLSGAIFQSEKEQLKQAIADKLREISNEVWRFFNVTCDIEISEGSGSLSSAIADKEKGYDLVIMGTNGIHDLMDFLMGSHSYRVIRKSSIPVLLIPANCLYSEVRRIVYAYNYVAERNLPVDQLLSWTQRLNSELTVLQVNEEAYSQDVEDEMKELQYILGERLRKENVTLSFDSIRTSEIAPSINSYMQKNKFDLLALCTSHHQNIVALFGPHVIKNTAGIADYPVFIFHK